VAQSRPEKTEAAPPAFVVQEDDDAVLDPAEPDFAVVNLPTTRRLRRFTRNFRLRHRFAGNLRKGTRADAWTVIHHVKTLRK
jgi:hypothetical protein